MTILHRHCHHKLSWSVTLYLVNALAALLQEQANSEAAAAQHSLQQLSTQLDAQTAHVNSLTQSFQLIRSSALFAFASDGPPQLPDQATTVQPDYATDNQHMTQPVYAKLSSVPNQAAAASGRHMTQLASMPDQGIGHLEGAKPVSVPDQAIAAWVVSGVQQLTDRCQSQDSELRLLRQRLDSCSAEADAAVDMMHAALQQASCEGNTGVGTAEVTHPSHPSRPSDSHISSLPVQGTFTSTTSSKCCDAASSNGSPESASPNACHDGAQPMQNCIRASLNNAAQAAAGYIKHASARFQHSDNQMGCMAKELQQAEAKSSEAEACSRELTQQLEDAQQSLQHVSCSTTNNVSTGLFNRCTNPP